MCAPIVRFLVAAMLLTVALEAGPVPSVDAQSSPPRGQPPDAWTPLGPGDNFYVNQLAVSPTFAQDGTLFAFA